MLTLPDCLRAVKDADGNVAEACELLGCSRVVFYRKVNKWPELQSAIDEARTVRRTWRKDKARSNVDKALDEGKEWATRLVLSADAEFAEHTVQDGEHKVIVEVVRK